MATQLGLTLLGASGSATQSASGSGVSLAALTFSAAESFSEQSTSFVFSSFLHLTSSPHLHSCLGQCPPPAHVVVHQKSFTAAWMLTHPVKSGSRSLVPNSNLGAASIAFCAAAAEPSSIPSLVPSVHTSMFSC